MIDHTSVPSTHYLASAYGEGAFNSSTYSGETSTITTPGTPNTGFFTGVLSGANEASLMPLLLIVAVTIGALSVVISRLLKRRRKHTSSK